MKLFRLVLSFSLLTMFAGVALAQTESKKAPTENSATEQPAAAGFAVPAGIKSRLFEVKHRDPGALANVLKGLASPQGLVQFNVQLRTLTVRDFPENIAVIEDALKRLDVPEPTSGNLEVTFHLLKGTKFPTDAATFPPSLQPVLKQLQGTLKFQGYQFVTTFTNRTLDGNPVEGSGVVSYGIPEAAPQKFDDKSSLRYKVTRVRITTDGEGKEVIQLTNFNVSLVVPVNNTSFRDLGFNTSLSLREGEQVVVGTTNIGDEAVIVVVSVKKVK